MAGLQKMMKQMKAGHWFMLIVVVVLVVAIYNYSRAKRVERDGMSAGNVLGQIGDAISGTEHKIEQQIGVNGAEPMPAVEGQHSDFASAEGTKTSAHGMPRRDVKLPVLSSDELIPRELPADANSSFALGNINQKDAINVNFASPFERIGTSMGVNRGRDLTVRKDIPNPKINNVSIWMNSTIEPIDPMYNRGV
jgi:hypothetical protein